MKPHARPWFVRVLSMIAIAAGLHGCGGGGGGGGGSQPMPDTTPPSVPAGVTATVVSATQITVSWQASTDAGSGVAGYRIYRDGGATPIATVTVTTYTDTGLSPSTQYRYAVRAYDRASPANESASSVEAAATTDAVAAGSGLDARPDNTTCVAGDRPSQATSLATQRVYPNLSFSSPVLLVQAPGDGSRWFVVEQAGAVRTFANQASVSTSQVFVDITSRVSSGGETGLLGMAFHPDFPTNPRVYLSYTTGFPLVSRISEFQTRDNGATLDPSSEKVILTVTQPASNHNGGNIAFGPDGFLYIGFGDGGGGGDDWPPIGNGQNLQTLLGKMLRIDISGSTGSVPYRIPPGNPYATNALCSAGTGSQSCPEIYAYGFRNPWRWSFDRGSGELWVGDVGQDAIEEVDRVIAGGNYGWRCFEGTAPYNSNCGPNAGSSLPPVAQYNHPTGHAVTGGYVYRGSAIPALSGRYVFGDYSGGRIWHIARDTAPTLTVTSGFDTGMALSAFGEGVDGELYVLNYGNGGIYKLVPASGTGGGAIASQLSATGCVLPNDATQPATGLIPYAPNAPFWSDGALKDRYLALPNGATLSVDAAGDVQFPNGTVLMKNFTLAGRRVETRLLMRHTDGEWAGYTYEWNAQGTDATRVVGGKTVTVNGQPWVFPSETQCLACHTAAAGRSLGLEIAQLNGNLFYPQTGRTANQVTTLDAIGLFSPPIATPPASLPAYRNPYGAAGTLTERARAWLHTNCAQCHRPGGGTPVNLDLRYDTALSATNTCNAVPQAGDLGIANARIIATGDAARSVLVARANRRDANAMPPLGSTVVDTAGVALLTNWVNSLANCN